MGIEIWYRGEGVGVPVATPGTTPAHDIGDGMYLTDTKAVAEQYATTRAVTPDARRVYVSNIETDKLKILDLTKDARWVKEMEPLAPGMPSNETVIKQANENYGISRLSWRSTKLI